MSDNKCGAFSNYTSEMGEYMDTCTCALIVQQLGAHNCNHNKFKLKQEFINNRICRHGEYNGTLHSCIKCEYNYCDSCLDYKRECQNCYSHNYGLMYMDYRAKFSHAEAKMIEDLELEWYHSRKLSDGCDCDDCIVCYCSIINFMWDTLGEQWRSHIDNDLIDSNTGIWESELLNLEYYASDVRKCPRYAIESDRYDKILNHISKLETEPIFDLIGLGLFTFARLDLVREYQYNYWNIKKYDAEIYNQETMTLTILTQQRNDIYIKLRYAIAT